MDNIKNELYIKILRDKTWIFIYKCNKFFFFFFWKYEKYLVKILFRKKESNLLRVN